MKVVPKSKLQQGFSLIELMIVFSIMTTLITISLVHYEGFKNSAYDSEAEGYIRHIVKLVRALDIDADTANISFELVNSTVATDSMNFIMHLPKLHADPRGMYLLISKTGPDLTITSFHCHGSYKYLYDSTAGEFIIQKQNLTSADLATKCLATN